MLRRVLARLGRALDLARLFDLPDRHPDRMIAASIGATRDYAGTVEMETLRNFVAPANARKLVHRYIDGKRLPTISVKRSALRRFSMLDGVALRPFREAGRPSRTSRSCRQSSARDG
jgi:hypothetical protein